MLRRDYYYENEEKDTCDVCEDQTFSLIAFGLAQACMHIGK